MFYAMKQCLIHNMLAFKNADISVEISRDQHQKKKLILKVWEWVFKTVNSYKKMLRVLHSGT